MAKVVAVLFSIALAVGAPVASFRWSPPIDRDLAEAAIERAEAAVSASSTVLSLLGTTIDAGGSSDSDTDATLEALRRAETTLRSGPERTSSEVRLRELDAATASVWQEVYTVGINAVGCATGVEYGESACSRARSSSRSLRSSSEGLELLVVDQREILRRPWYLRWYSVSAALLIALFIWAVALPDSDASASQAGKGSSKEAQS